VPLFRLAGGRILPIGEAHANDVVEALVRSWEQAGGRHGETPVVFHAGPEEAAARLASATGCSLPPAPFSPAMMAHTGAGVIGLAWLRCE
jgi:fatty acid-binding protein DegV